MESTCVRRKRIDKDVSIEEMRHMRDQGMSNHDIAKSLDICYATVLRYIGKQNGRMEHVAVMSERPAKKLPNEEHNRMQLNKVGAIYSCGDFLATIDYADGTVLLATRGGMGMSLSVKDLQSFAQFAVSIAYKGGAKNAQ